MQVILLNNQDIQYNKQYALLSCLNYTLHIVSPDSHFIETLKAHLYTCNLAELNLMCFLDNRKEEPLWNSNIAFKPIIKH